MSEEQQKTFQVQRIYTKDISFEAPGAPEVFVEQRSSTSSWVTRHAA